MSSDLERRVRELGERLRDPSEEATRRAGRRADAAAGRGGRRRRLPLRWGLAVGVALLIGSGFGFALGTSSTSSGNAANSPLGLGFLPERGWSVLQTASKPTLAQEAIAIAANVPLHPDDAADRLPYSTMLRLPPNGVVILAGFTARGDPFRDEHYPLRALPLRLRDAVPGSIQLRPERPLGQYRLSVGINGHNVDVNVYFGTPRPTPALVAAAQRQLDRLVVRSTRRADRVEERAFPIRPPAARAVKPLRPTALVIDRTFSCTLVAPLGTTRDLDLIAGPRYVDRFRNFTAPAFIGSSSGRVLAGQVSDQANLVFIRARPNNLPGRVLPPGVYANLQSCARSRTAVSLSARGLVGPPVEFEKNAECALRGRVRVRVRARLQTSAGWRPFQDGYVGAQANVREAKLAVRSVRTRRPLAYIELLPTGKTRFWATGACT
jgi:hypothetical protein